MTSLSTLFLAILCVIITVDFLNWSEIIGFAVHYASSSLILWDVAILVISHLLTRAYLAWEICKIRALAAQETASHLARMAELLEKHDHEKNLQELRMNELCNKSNDIVMPVKHALRFENEIAKSRSRVTKVRVELEYTKYGKTDNMAGKKKSDPALTSILLMSQMRELKALVAQQRNLLK